MLNLILGVIGLILHALVVYYGYQMYRMLNPVRYWTSAWLFFSAANLFILIRRFIAIFTLCSPLTFSWYVFLEVILQIAISILLVVFVKQLHLLYGKYFTDGLDIPSWTEEQLQQKKKK
jgi:hypothetical protein